MPPFGSATSTGRRASPASLTRSARRWRSSSRACSTPTISTAISPSSTAPTAPSSTGSTSGDADLRRRYAADRVANDLAAWDGKPVYAYGFEDLSAAQWRLLEALAGRADVTVSLPYEPGRLVFASLERTVLDLARLAAGSVEELPPRYAEYAHPALAYLERALFADVAGGVGPPMTDGAIRFLEAAGSRATLELVADEILDLLRSGTAPAAILVVCPSLDRVRAPLETAFGALGVPYALDGMLRLPQTPYGRAVLSLLRFAWLGGGRRDLFGFIRSPYSGLHARTPIS